MVYYSATTTNGCEHFTKFEQKIISSQEPEDLQRRLTYQNNWGGHSILIETPST